MNKSYTPENIIRQSRFVHFMDAQSEEMQKAVSQRVGELIEENHEYCVPVNFQHMRNLLTALAIHEYDLGHGMSSEDSLNRISQAMEEFMQPTRVKYERLLSSRIAFAVVSPLIPRKMMTANGAGFMIKPIEVKKGFGFDTTECIFPKITTQYGCPDLGCRFCAIDEYMYSHIPNVRFTRTGTLCRGNEKCDFRFVWEKGANK